MFKLTLCNLCKDCVNTGVNKLEIKLFNRYTGQMELEKVYGEGAVRWLYESAAGKALGPLVVAPLTSKFYGAVQSSNWSAQKVIPFIKNFGIQMDEFEVQSQDAQRPFKSFNDFFIRPFKAGKRPFVNGDKMGAFAEARYFGYESLTHEEKIPVKGQFLASSAVVNSAKWESTFEGGPCLLARLCPVDYHRFHYPDNGKVLDHFRVKGQLHSVNPLALKKRPDIFMRNERVVTILETENFGKLAYVEVGAVCVGKIVQSGSLEKFNRGDEKGYFLFGGSTVIVFGEKGKWVPSADILKATKAGHEVYVRLGDAVALSLLSK